MTDPSLVLFDPDQFNCDSNEDFSEEEDDFEDELADGDADAGKSGDKGKVPKAGVRTIIEEVAPVGVSVLVSEDVKAASQPEAAGQPDAPSTKESAKASRNQIASEPIPPP